MRIPGYTLPKAAGLGLLLFAGLLATKSARAEVTLAETNGWTFFADGRINGFLSAGFGDAFPKPIPPPVDPISGLGTRGSYTVLGASAGWTVQAPRFEQGGSYFASRARTGFVGTIFGFGLKRDVTDTTTAKGYIGVWTTIEALNRDKLQTQTTDVRVGYVSLDGPWGGLLAGRDLGLFGRTSTEIDFLYGHNFGLGLPCMDVGGNPTCGHVGTGVIGAGFGAGMVYSTPVLGGLQLKAGLYDPVRLLGAWDRAAILRPEAQLSWQTGLGETGLLRFAVEGIWQSLESTISEPTLQDISTSVWGVAGGGRVEAGPVRFGAAAFHGRGLGFYTALQNDLVVFDGAGSGGLSIAGDLRTFTGYYGQGALVFGPLQVSLGAGTVQVNQLPQDEVNPNLSTYKSQTGLSTALYYSLSDNVVVGLDYFRLMMRWYGARNNHFQDPANGDLTIVLDPGVINEEALDINFVNAGVTFHW